MPRYITLFIMAFLLNACGTLYRDIGSVNTMLTPGYQVLKPEGAGPFPVVLLYHGCGGLTNQTGDKDIMKRYAQVAVAEGYTAVIVDSFGPRGISFKQRAKVCGGLTLRGPTRAADIIASIKYAKALPYTTDTDYIIAGWSHGGWAIMEVMTYDMKDHWPAWMAKPPPDSLDPVQAVYLTYPYCGIGSQTANKGWPRPVPASVLWVKNDTVAKPGSCDAAFTAIRKSGVDLQIETFEGVTHAFDESDHPESSSYKYDAEVTKRAHERFAAFLNAQKREN